MTDPSEDDPNLEGSMGSLETTVTPHATSTWKVLGQIDAASGIGVLGHNTATSGTAIGVKGVTDSTHERAAGVLGVSSSSGSAAAIRAEGHVDTTDVGLSVWLGSDQTIPTETERPILFDSIRRDDFDAYDSTTGVYTVQEPGDYHVDFTVRWRDFFGSDGTPDIARHRVYVNGSLDRGIRYETSLNSGKPPEHHSKTVFDLSTGDTLRVTVWQSGDENAIVGDPTEESEYLTIHKVG